MERYNDYDDWAWLYNQTVGPSYAYNFQVLERTLLPTVCEGANLLDLCCGTGQISQLVAQEGFCVTGLDGSEAMLEFARSNVPKANFLLDDARNFQVVEKFDGAFCTCAALNHTSSIDDLKRIFRCVSKSLSNGATFVFDINHPASMRKDWRGKPIVGEVRADHAWVVTTNYDSSNVGSFLVDIYKAPDASVPSELPLLKRFIFSMLGRHFKAAQLRLIKKFSIFHSEWRHSQLSYSVYGYDLMDIEAALKKSGFCDVSIQCMDGNPNVTENDDAYFVCINGS